MILCEHDKPIFFLQWNTSRREVPLKTFLFQITFCQPYLLSSYLLIAKILEYLPILIPILISHFLFNLLQCGYRHLHLFSDWYLSGVGLSKWHILSFFPCSNLWIGIRNFILFILKLCQKRSLFSSELFGY